MKLSIKTYDKLVIDIPIDPLPTKETQFRIVNGRFGKPIAVGYTPTDKAEYIKKCLPFLYDHKGWCDKGIPVKAVFYFYKKPPKIHSNEYWITVKPDTDNLIKTIKDCLGSSTLLRNGNDRTMGAGVIWNDSQICYETGVKIYSQQPRIRIVLQKIRKQGAFNPSIKDKKKEQLQFFI